MATLEAHILLYIEGVKFELELSVNDANICILLTKVDNQS